uniref:Uncharacterized protein n=1 Tax=Panagrolaimus superbus TaxID=310955 RepID=A0A914Y753_9BILA
MEDLLTTPWILWKIQYSPEFKTEKLMTIKSLKYLENILGGYNLSKDYFALFRDGISPDIYDQRSNCAFKHEVSIWMNLQNNNEHSGQLLVDNQVNFYLDATGLFWSESSVCSDSLKCPWTIGFSNEYKLELTMFQDTVESEEHLAKLLRDSYALSEKEKCIILQSDMLNFDEWRIPNLNNRFIYSCIQTDLKNANKILKKFILNLTVSIFPHIRLIYAAFGFFLNGNLELGVYLTGKESILLPNVRRFRAGPDDLAFTLAHKMKQIILSEYPPEKEVKVLIRNAVPPEHFDFTNLLYQYPTYDKKFVQYL